jgi:hypothetical protein
MNRKLLIATFVLAFAFIALAMGAYAQEHVPHKPENIVIEPARPSITVPIENVRPPDITIPKENFENVSPYQQYVTPYAPAVQALAMQVSSIEDAYQRAVRWVWVSDKTLNGVNEKWLYPQEFLTDTPTYQTNPVQGRVASDCEEQAYTLVSLIRASGTPAEYVRVAIGKVKFGDEEGGHAWAEIYIENTWMALESTSGPYWDDDNHRLVERNGLPYDYFGSYEYPSIEVWAYFNDAYYYNPWTGEGNAPSDWQTAGPPSRYDWVLMILYIVIFAALAILVVEIALIMRKKKTKKRKRRAKPHLKSK